MNWYKNLKTATKMLGGYGLMAVIIVLQSYFSITEMASLDESIKVLHQKHALGIVHLNAAIKEIDLISRAINSAVLSDDPAVVPKQVTEIQQYRENFSREFEAYKQALIMETTKVKAAEIEKLLT